MLDINNLTIKYSNDVKAVSDFSLSLKKGEVVSIVGESGSGKTTVIRSIMNSLPKNAQILEGTIEFEGKDILKCSEEDMQKIRGKDISMIFQDCGNTLNPVRKIGTQFIEYIRYHSDVSKDEAYELAVGMMKRMNLRNCEEIMKEYAHQLSGGMKQRVGIAMAMTFSPKLLLADEPTSALDVTTQAKIVEELQGLRESFDTSIILVTHNLGVAAHLADRIIVMKNGLVVEQGSSQKVVKAPEHEYTKLLLDAMPKIGGDVFV